MLSIFVPPEEEVYHPIEVYPVFVTVGRVPYGYVGTTVFEYDDGVPPFPLNVTITLILSRVAVPLTVNVPSDIPLANVARM